MCFFTPSCGSPLFVMPQLSYHVDQQHDMRCYFYFAGQCARFLPEDFDMLLPLFFVDNDSNKKFKGSDESARLMKAMRGLLKGMSTFDA